MFILSCLLGCFHHLWFILFSSGDSLGLPRVQCPNHPDSTLVEDYRAGDMICPECGLVVGQYCTLNKMIVIFELPAGC